MNKSITLERWIAAEPDRVFSAWSDPESLAVWMCPGDMSGASAEVDFRVGGFYRIVMHGERDYVQTGRYLEIEPGKRLVFEWISEWVPVEESRTRVTVRFEAVEGGTRLVLVHDQLPDSDTYDGHEGGWSSILDKLANHL